MCLLEKPLARVLRRCRVIAQNATPRRAITAAAAPIPIPALAPTASPAGSLDLSLSGVDEVLASESGDVVEGEGFDVEEVVSAGAVVASALGRIS